MEKKFTEKESLDLIIGMIENAKSNVKKGLGLYSLLWGYLVVLAGLTNFIFYGQKWATLGWLIMIPVGLVCSIFIARRTKRIRKVYTHADRFVGSVWIAFGISMALMLFSAFDLVPLSPGGYRLFYVVLLILAAVATFVSGTIYNFKPLKIGAIVCWACAIACFYVSWRYNILLYVVGFFFGALIPGHMIVASKKIAS